MTIKHLSIKEITRNRKRLKKIFINSFIIKEIFNREYRKKLKIPFFINYYNYYINLIDIANQLRVIVIVYFSRNKKKFFFRIF